MESDLERNITGSEDYHYYDGSVTDRKNVLLRFWSVLSGADAFRTDFRSNGYN